MVEDYQNVLMSVKVHNDHINLITSIEGVNEARGWARDYFTVNEQVKRTIKAKITNYVHANPSEKRAALVCLKGKPHLTWGE